MVAHISRREVPLESFDVLRARLRRTRPTVRNLRGLLRWAVFALKYPQLRRGLFYADTGVDLRIRRGVGVEFGPGLCLLRDCSLELSGITHIGSDVFFNRGAHVVCHEALSIGDRCIFGEYVSIHDENHVPDRSSEAGGRRSFVTKPVVIEDNVWVGAKATILAGAHIGRNSVIGAGAVVTGEIPPCVIAAGVPARIIRRIA